MDAASLIGMDTLRADRSLRPGLVHCCAQSGGFGVLDEINMAKNEALAVLHAVLDFAAPLNAAGLRAHPAGRGDPLHRQYHWRTTAIAGTCEPERGPHLPLRVIQDAHHHRGELEKPCAPSSPDLNSKYVRQFALALPFDLQKSATAEISTKALDLRGMLDALAADPPGRSCRGCAGHGHHQQSLLIPTSRGSSGTSSPPASRRSSLPKSSSADGSPELYRRTAARSQSGLGGSRSLWI